MLFRTLLLCVGFSRVGEAALLHAQGAPASAPAALVEQAKSTMSLGRISGARELRDGRLLISDAQAQLLFVLDVERQTKRQLGRTGDGPGEYRGPGAILALSGDSSLLLDNNNRKWYVLEADRFVNAPLWLKDHVPAWRGELSGVSSAGQYLDVTALGVRCRASFPLPRGRPECSDSVAMVRRRPVGTEDTVARGKSWFLGSVAKQQVINGRAQSFFAMHPLQSFDQGMLFPDGAIAIARVRPYAVQWISPNGTVANGPEIREPAVTLNARQQVAIAEAYTRDVNGDPIYRAADFPTWPPAAPAFLSRALVPGMDGRLYVLRTWDGASPVRRVDVFDRAGRRVGAFQIPRDERLLAVSRTSIYVARSDENEEEIVVRYGLPPGLR